MSGKKIYYESVYGTYSYNPASFVLGHIAQTNYFDGCNSIESTYNIRRRKFKLQKMYGQIC